MQAGAAFAETERLVPTALHLAHHEDPEGQQEDKRNGIDQDRNPAAAAFFVVMDVHALGQHGVVESLVIGRDVRLQLLVVFLVGARQVGTGDGDGFDLACIHVVHQRCIGELCALLRFVVVDHGPEEDHHHDDHHPEDGGLYVRIIHSFSYTAPREAALPYWTLRLVMDYSPQQHHHHNRHQPEDGNLDPRIVHSFFPTQLLGKHYTI